MSEQYFYIDFIDIELVQLEEMYFRAIFSEDYGFFGCVHFDYDLFFVELVVGENLSVGKWEYTELSLWFAHEEKFVFEECYVVDLAVFGWLFTNSRGE